MNRCLILGNLTRDPELRTTSGSAVSVCTFTLAVQRRYADGNGHRETDFIPVVTWRGTAENCAKHLRKGSQVAVFGAIQTRTYDGNDGQKRYVTEVIADEVQFLNRIQGQSQGQERPAARREDAPAYEASAGQTEMAYGRNVSSLDQSKRDMTEIMEDDLPF